MNYKDKVMKMYKKRCILCKTDIYVSDNDVKLCNKCNFDRLREELQNDLLGEKER